MKIDVHMLLPENKNESLFNRCMESLSEDLNNDSIDLHFSDAIEGRLGLARKNAYLLGDNDWVSLVDFDDQIRSGAFTRLLGYLSDDLSALYTNHSIYNQQGKYIGNWFSEVADDGYSKIYQMHHLIVFRRDILEEVLPMLDDLVSSESYPMNIHAISKGKVLGLNQVEYDWFKYDNGTHRRYQWRNNPRKLKKWCVEKKKEIQKNTK